MTTMKIYWSPTEPWQPRETKELSPWPTSLVVVKRFWGRNWESHRDHRPTLSRDDMDYLMGVRDAGNPDDVWDANALMDAIDIYGEIVLELREVKAMLLKRHDVTGTERLGDSRTSSRSARAIVPRRVQCGRMTS